MSEGVTVPGGFLTRELFSYFGDFGNGVYSPEGNFFLDHWTKVCWPDAMRLITGVTGQVIPAGLYPELKRPRLDYTRVCCGLGQFISRDILWPGTIHTPSGQIIHP